jgi:NAD(P)-dependent dehydrogenase (short-subunit alcohol dehydrogenase family)
MCDFIGKTVLVGGGCGLIGKSIVIALREQGADASSVDIAKGADYKINLVVDTALKELFDNVKPDIMLLIRILKTT